MLKPEDIDVRIEEDKHNGDVIISCRVKKVIKYTINGEVLLSAPERAALLEYHANECAKQLYEDVTAAKELRPLLDNLRTATVNMLWATNNLAHTSFLKYEADKKTLDDFTAVYDQALSDLTKAIEGE